MIETIDQLVVAGPPARKFLFRVDLPPDLDTTGEIADRIVSVDMGGLKLTTNTGFPFYANWDMALPEVFELGEVSFLFWEDEGGNVTSFLERWADMMWDPATKEMRPPNNYWRDIRIEMLRESKREFPEAGKHPLWDTAGRTLVGPSWDAIRRLERFAVGKRTEPKEYPKFGYEPWKILKLVNCFPSNWYVFDLSYEDNAYVGIRVPLNYSAIERVI